MIDKDKTNYETSKHIRMVSKLLGNILKELVDRSNLHDQSKLESPEDEIFAKYTPILAGLTYGSEEYYETLKEMQVAINHHYEWNRHHPEHHANGIDDMNLVDIIEMLVDWKAATLRHNDGDILKSIEINKKRFNISDQLTQILLNTVELLEIG